ncbi:MAG: DUF1295 domain-containing protein [Steroidobacteraceae bacterium]
MFDLSVYLAALVVLAGAAALTWVVSVLRHNVAIVDSLWSLLFLMAALTYAASAPAAAAGSGGPTRAAIVLVLVAAWALRLAIYITARNWGEEEDRRYQKIRRRNEPGFAFKSLYLVFLLQAGLAWIISLPLHGAILGGAGPPGALDLAAVLLWFVGFAFEAGGDWQLARFKRDPASRGQIADYRLALDAPRELLRRLLRLVGVLPVRTRRGRVVELPRPAADVGAADARVGRDAARRTSGSGGLCGSTCGARTRSFRGLGEVEPAGEAGVTGDVWRPPGCAPVSAPQRLPSLRGPRPLSSRPLRPQSAAASRAAFLRSCSLRNRLRSRIDSGVVTSTTHRR